MGTSGSNLLRVGSCPLNSEMPCTLGGQDRNVIDSIMVSAIEWTIHSKPSECDLGSFCGVSGRAYPRV